MSEVLADDWQRWRDEIQRCALLSTEQQTTGTQFEKPTHARNARYYTERGRVLSAVGPERGITFLREEALRALAGERDGAMTRWLRLHALEHNGAVWSVADAMNAGVEKAVREGVADMLAERNRARRAARLRCPECGGAYCDNEGCLT